MPRFARTPYRLCEENRCKKDNRTMDGQAARPGRAVMRRAAGPPRGLNALPRSLVLGLEERALPSAGIVSTKETDERAATEAAVSVACSTCLKAILAVTACASLDLCKARNLS